ncbi:hypothetical protein MO867_17725 [Microbulbifer sp. OS29]|uniref:Uncharacterized protein n=1 Tax=Microbulbifer okhotskensis TaxID=2926617 RepID=A0A9X2EQW7_9GAMM|nr:hypothetical protein [Microbulbifer okhotskensis]MCO1336174.1 hypothetical protein [Microbulbifer okhotskensis]
MTSLRDLAKNGRLGAVYFTMHAERVKEILGAPCETGGGSNKYKWENIWLYGDVELGFERESRELWHIAIPFYSEGTPTPRSGSISNFDPWIFRQGLLLEEFLSECNAEGIKVKELTKSLSMDEAVKVFLTEGGMHLVFEGSDSTQEYCLGKLVASEIELV